MIEKLRDDDQFAASWRVRPFELNECLDCVRQRHGACDRDKELAIGGRLGHCSEVLGRILGDERFEVPADDSSRYFGRGRVDVDNAAFGLKEGLGSLS